MRILQITYSLTSGGAERLVVDLSNELSNRNEVFLVTILDEEINDNGFYKKDLSEKVNYVSLKQEKGFSLKKLYKLYKVIQKISPDIVHLHGKNIILFCSPSILFNKKISFIETLHSKADVLFEKKYTIIHQIILKLNLVKMVTISDENKLSLENTCNINNSKLIYNGRSKPIKSRLFNEVKNEINSLKNSKKDIVFIHVARFVPVKNQKVLIAAFNELYKEFDSFIVLILGSGFDSDKALELKEMANPNIHFLGTKINIIDYFMCSDAFCLTSLYEGMPISLIEALACECLPICTPTSGVIDVLEDGKTGLISKGFTTSSYKLELEKYIKSDFDKSTLHQTYRDLFSIEKCASLYDDLYNDILHD